MIDLQSVQYLVDYAFSLSNLSATTIHRTFTGNTLLKDTAGSSVNFINIIGCFYQLSSLLSITIPPELTEIRFELNITSMFL
jgi:hypothetical protein